MLRLTYTGTTAVQDGTLQLLKADGTVAVPGGLIISDPIGNDSAVEYEANAQLGSGAAATIYSGGLLDLTHVPDEAPNLAESVRRHRPSSRARSRRSQSTSTDPDGVGS